MGLINRETTAPIAQGDSMDPNEVEKEIAKIFDAVNGNLDNANIASAAGIVGSKISAGTIDGDRIATSTLTTGQMAAAAVTKANLETVTSTGGNVSFTSSATYVNCDGFSGFSLTPGSTNDMVLMDFTCAIVDNGGGSGTYMFGMSVGGSDTDCQEVAINGTNTPQIIHITYMVQAAAASSTAYIPRYKKLSGSDVGEFVDDSLRIFRVWIVPIK